MLAIDQLVITGSNGFVGQSLLSHLDSLSSDEQPRKIILLNRTDQSNVVLSNYQRLDIEYRLIDLEQPWTFEIPNAHLINLAADGSANAYSESASKLFVKIGTNCARWVKQNRPIKVFHASSGASLGVVPLLSNVKPKNDERVFEVKEKFIESRLSVEGILTNLAEDEGLDIMIGRLFSFIGPNILNKSQYAVTSFIRGAVEQGLILVKGSPNTVRSYLHETDMSTWILRSLQSAKSPRIFSVGSSVKVTISELAEFIATATRAKVEYLNPNAPGDIYTAENALTIESLGVTETKNWQDAVIECIEIAKGQKN